MKFLKNFGLGLVTIILLPFFLIVLAVFAVYLFVIYGIELVRNLIRFFKGEKGLPKLSEDLKVDAIKKKNLEQAMMKEEPKEETKVPQAPPGPTHVYIQQNYYQKSPNANQNAPMDAPSLNSDYQNKPANPSLNPQIQPQNFIDANPFGNLSSASQIEDPSKTEGGHNS